MWRCLEIKDPHRAANIVFFSRKLKGFGDIFKYVQSGSFIDAMGFYRHEVV